MKNSNLFLSALCLLSVAGTTQVFRADEFSGKRSYRLSPSTIIQGYMTSSPSGEVFLNKLVFGSTSLGNYVTHSGPLFVTTYISTESDPSAICAYFRLKGGSIYARSRKAVPTSVKVMSNSQVYPIEQTQKIEALRCST